MAIDRPRQDAAPEGRKQPPQGEPHKILSPAVSLLITIVYSTEQHSTTRNEWTYKRCRSPWSVVSCWRELAFVEFKCTRSAPWGISDQRPWLENNRWITKPSADHYHQRFSDSFQEQVHQVTPPSNYVVTIITTSLPSEMYIGLTQEGVRGCDYGEKWFHDS